ncbi:hypothetical protein IMX07_06320 [bacterium]|nr:hypothetical protein [bacterium]
MKPLGLAVAASLLTILALSPRCPDARATTDPVAAQTRFNLRAPAMLAQNDQMNMQQENSGADTGDQSPPDDQSVDTETGDSVEPQAGAPEDNNPGTEDPQAEPPEAAQPGYNGADAGKDASDYESEDDETDPDNSGNLMNNEGGFSASQDQPPGAQP